MYSELMKQIKCAAIKIKRILYQSDAEVITPK